MNKDLLNLDIFTIPTTGKHSLIDEAVNEDLIDKNKYANNSEFIPESVYKRILNKVTDYKWSFVPHEITEHNVEGGKGFIRFIGLLIIPGLGIHTGIGTAPLNKKDNQNAASAAKTYAFKNACKELGLAPNVGDKNYDPDEVLFEDIDPDDEPEPKEEPKKNNKKKKKQPKKPASLKDQIAEVRAAYELEDDDDDFIAFIQIWDEEVLELEDMDDNDWKKFLKYLEEHKDEFEDF